MRAAFLLIVIVLVSCNAVSCKTQKRDALWYYERGNARLRASNSTGAMADYSKAIELDKTFYHAYFSRAALYLKSNNLRDAASDYSTLIQLASDTGTTPLSPLLNRGKVFMMLGEYERAIDDFTKVVELEPGFKPVVRPLLEEAERLLAK